MFKQAILALTFICAPLALAHQDSQPKKEQTKIIKPIFKASEKPKKPNSLEKVLIFLFGIEQNHWKPMNMVKFYGTQLAGEALYTGCGRKLEFSHLKKFLISFLQKAICEKQLPIAKKALLATQETLLYTTPMCQYTANIIEKPEEQNFIKGLASITTVAQYLLAAKQTSSVLKKIKKECSQLGIHSNITYGSIPTNSNQLIILNKYALIFSKLVSGLLSLQINKHFNTPQTKSSASHIQVFSALTVLCILAADDLGLKHYSECKSDDPLKISRTLNMLQLIVSALFSSLYSVFSYFADRVIIPYETLEKLSPALQEEVYNLALINKTLL